MYDLCTNCILVQCARADGSGMNFEPIIAQATPLTECRQQQLLELRVCNGDVLTLL